MKDAGGPDGMPVDVSTFPELGLRWVRASGTVSAADLSAASLSAFPPDGAGAQPLGFVDLRDATGFDLGFADVMQTRNRAQGATERHGLHVRVAIHAGSEVGFGLGRMYEQLLATVGIEAMVTYDRDEALRWLNLSRVPPALRG
ncbi:hypothetical protein [Thetidibacter halocola]|uniref:STAS/SEC14 domain-containing protein n=1 Tax=Thetidibacter halocola TaxID=2827239 RepID=A0A8J7WA34_9RHOB|nr:hypothetical protein [Thetidibacter halocola]MBS0123775.1 hypothetical protein [Thetidibacter halocola]